MHRPGINGAEEDTDRMTAQTGDERYLMPSRRGWPVWRRSSWSANNGNCVEVTLLRGGQVGVRDSKDPRGQVLAFPQDAWQSFLAAVRAGHPGS